jgi:hypothetical protein
MLFGLLGMGTVFFFGEVEDWQPEFLTGSDVWHAGVAMLLSIASAGWGFTIASRAIDASAANDHRCLAIQHDMLSARPRRADSPDLFQALGCRPQGEGSVYALPRSRPTPGSPPSTPPDPGR